MFYFSTFVVLLVPQLVFSDRDDSIAILVSGGLDVINFETMTSVELLLSDGTPWCSLPSLPDGGRGGHTQSGLVACGCADMGQYEAGGSCVTFSGGQWRTSHYLQHRRSGHASWASTQHGPVLIGGGTGDGGDDTGYTTEMVTDDGDSQGSFPLKYYTG